VPSECRGTSSPRARSRLTCCSRAREHTQLYFEGGWIRTEAPPLLLRNVPATVEVYRGNTPAKTATHTFPEGGREWSYKAEMRHFAECVRTGAPFRSPASDTIEDVRTFEAIYGRHIGMALT